MVSDRTDGPGRSVHPTVTEGLPSGDALSLLCQTEDAEPYPGPEPSSLLPRGGGGQASVGVRAETSLAFLS